MALGEIVGKSLEKYLYNYFLDTGKAYANDKQNERLFRTIQLSCNEHLANSELYYKSITAIAKTGEYGVEAEIVDSNDTSKTKTMSSSEAPVLPFGFAIYFNPSKDTAVLITQSSGRNSIASVIKCHLRNMVKNIDNKLCAEIKNVVPHSLLKKLLNHDVIKSISVEVYKEGDFDFVDEYGDITTLQTSRKVSTFKKPLITNKDFLFNIFTQNRKICKIAGLTNDDEVIENLIVNFSGKTLNYNAYHNTRITEDISNCFDDVNIVYPIKLFEIMDERVVEYLNLLKIIVPIGDCEIKKETKNFFYIDSEKDDVIEKHIIKVTVK